MSKSMQRRRVTYMGALVAAVLSLGITSTAGATYNSNITGNLTSLITYENGVILFVLDSQPTANGACDPRYFEIDPVNNTEGSLNRMYQRLLAAYTHGPAVEIGYDNTSACGSLNYIHVYRVG